MQSDFTKVQMKHIVERKNQSRVWGILFCLLLFGALGGCRPDAEFLYDDLADLAADELRDMLGENTLSEVEANDVIMSAREHWFKDENSENEK